MNKSTCKTKIVFKRRITDIKETCFIIPPTQEIVEASRKTGRHYFDCIFTPRAGDRSLKIDVYNKPIEFAIEIPASAAMIKADRACMDSEAFIKGGNLHLKFYEERERTKRVVARSKNLQGDGAA